MRKILTAVNRSHGTVFVTTEGVQTRSRVILVHGADCPEQMIDSRRCSASSDCPRYSWNTSEWIGNRRDVWCQDSHGNTVYGTTI